MATMKKNRVAPGEVLSADVQSHFFVSASLELPSDYSRSTASSAGAGKLAFRCPANLSSEIRRLSLKLKVTPTETLLSVFAILLARYSNLKQVSLACFLAASDVRDAASKTAVITGDLQSNPCFSRFLENIHAALLSPDSAQRQFSGSDSNATSTDESSEYQLALTVEGDAEIVSGYFEFETSLFEQATIERMADCYICLLNSALFNPECPVYQLEIIEPRQRKMMLEDWNNTQSPYLLQGDLVSLLEKAAITYATRLAVAGPDADLTYALLHKRANRLAHLLCRRGFGTGSIVGICLERSAEMIVAMLAVLKAGAAYLPMDAAYPRDRILYALQDAGVALVLTQKELVHLLSGSSAETLLLDDTELSKFPETDGARHPGQADLAYVIYTSGSTGRPKGVMVQHRSLLNVALWHKHQFALRPQDRSTQICSPGFDVCGWEIWPVLLAGASIHIVEEEVKLLPEKLRSWLVARQITLNFSPPILAELLMSGPWPPETALRFMFIGGDRLTRRPPEYTPFCVINVYGPTEATIWATFGEVSTSDSYGRLPDIGRPIFNNRTYILDQYLQPVPIGVPGELCLGGEGVAAGYVHDPSPDNPRFVRNPHGAGRLYRTGDIACYLGDGRIHFIGRADQQVKLRGYRVELGEIKSVLEEEPDISQAAVAVEKDGNVEALVAYVVPRKQIRSDQELRQVLSRKLPHYMLPSRFVLLHSLPLSPSGKLDRQRLTGMQPIRASAPARLSAAPQTEIQSKLVEVWSGVLSCADIGIYDNLFEFGVNSLLAMRAVAQSARLRLRFTVRDVYRSQTIADLAKVVVPLQFTGQQPTCGNDASQPITPMEQWFFEQDFFSPQYWNTSMLFQIDGVVDPTALRVAIEKVIDAHEALRTQFRQSGGSWIKYVDETDDTDCFQTFDLSRLSREEQPDEVRQICGLLHASFTLGKGRLIRFACLNLGHHGYRLFVTAHHLVCDAFSMRTIIDDLYVLLTARPSKQLSTTTMHDFARRINGDDALAQAIAEHAHWAPRQIGTIPLDFPDGRPQIKSMCFAGVEFDRDQSAALLHLARQRYRCGVDVVLLSCAIYSVMRWQNDFRIAVNVVGHGREPIWPDIDVSRTVGWLTVHNTLLVEFPSWTTPSEAVLIVARQIERIPNSGRGYGILRHIHHRASLSGRLPVQPEPQVFFNYLGDQDILYSNDMFRRASEETGPSMHPEGCWPYPLGMFAGIRDAKIQAGWFFSRNVHRDETVEILKNRFYDIVDKLLC